MSWGSAKCDRASAYAELNGAQLAWLATKVPSIMDSWPGCDAVHGTVPGTWKATYGEAPLSDGGRDGTFWWKIECLDTPNFPDTAEP